MISRNVKAQYICIYIYIFIKTTHISFIAFESLRIVAACFITSQLPTMECSFPELGRSSMSPRTSSCATGWWFQLLVCPRSFRSWTQWTPISWHVGQCWGGFNTTVFTSNMGVRVGYDSLGPWTPWTYGGQSQHGPRDAQHPDLDLAQWKSGRVGQGGPRYPRVICHSLLWYRWPMRINNSAPPQICCFCTAMSTGRCQWPIDAVTTTTVWRYCAIWSNFFLLNEHGSYICSDIFRKSKCPLTTVAAWWLVTASDCCPGARWQTHWGFPRRLGCPSWIP